MLGKNHSTHPGLLACISHGKISQSSKGDWEGPTDRASHLPLVDHCENCGEEPTDDAWNSFSFSVWCLIVSHAPFPKLKGVDFATPSPIPLFSQSSSNLNPFQPFRPTTVFYSCFVTPLFRWNFKIVFHCCVVDSQSLSLHRYGWFLRWSLLSWFCAQDAMAMTQPQSVTRTYEQTTK